MLVMVWLLPVPGGPCKTKLAPVRESATAEYCELSAESGMRVSCGSHSSSEGTLTSCRASRSPISAETILLPFSASKWLRMSFHMR